MSRPSRLPAADLDRRARYVVAAAASLPERAGAPWLCPVATPSGVVRQRLDMWRQRSAGGDDADFQALCRARRIGDPRAWVSDVTVPEGVAVPRWAQTLRAFLAAAATGTTPADREAVERCSARGLVLTASMVPVPAGRGVTAFAPAVSLLRKELSQAGPASRLLINDLLADLAQCLLERLGGLLLQKEWADGPAAALDWGELLGVYPAAGRCLGSLLDGYIGYATELCRRLDTDAASLSSLVGAPPGTPLRAVSCRPRAGDLHAGARSVTIVELEGACSQRYRAVYKPRHLSHVAVLASVVRAAGLDLRLPACVLRQGYGWQAFIEPRPACAPGDVAGVARDLGAWALVFHLLGTSDLLAENVRICGSRLVPIDVEAMFSFRFSNNPDCGASASGVVSNNPACDASASGVRPDLLWEPPGSTTGLFSTPLLRGPGKAHDVGLLAGHGRPLLAEAERVVTGYADAVAAAGRRRHGLGTALATAAVVPVRAIVRNTQTYDNLLDQSMQPGALVDGVARDLTLERLWAAHLHGHCPASVVEAEIAAIRRLDVPVFAFAAGTRQLWAVGPPGPGKGEGPERPLAVLQKAPLSRATERIAALAVPAGPAELDALRAAMFCAAENHRGSVDHRAHRDGTGEKPPKDRPKAARPTAGRSRAVYRRSALPAWDERAATAASECAKWLRTGGPGGAALAAGLSYVSKNDADVLGARRPFDLFSGSPGLAVALASLVRSFGQPIVAEAAEASAAEADEMGRACAENFCAWAERGALQRALGWAYGGTPALAVLCASTGAGTSALRQLCEALAAIDAIDVAPNGVLEALAATTAALRRTAGGDLAWAKPAADRAGQLLRQIAKYAAGGPRFPSNLGVLVPSERSLADWALGARLEADRVDPRVGQPPARPNPNVKRAGSGDRLVAAAICPAELEPMPQTALGQLSDTALVAEVEVCLVAARHCAEFRQNAEAAGSVLVTRRDTSGQWFAGSLAPDRLRLSAVWGALACAHVLAGLANPAGFSSIRLFEPATA